MAAKRLVIGGIVQGVGYRHWLAATARRLGVDGWVRNRSDGTVEALVYAETDVVEELVRACRRGPMLAQVTLIEEFLAEPPDGPGFVVLPTA